MKSKELLAENLRQGLDEQNKNSVLEQMAHTYNIWTAEQNLSLFFMWMIPNWNYVKTSVNFLINNLVP